MHLVCHTCLSSRGRETSGADTAGGKSEKRDSSGGKGKGPAGTSSGVKLRQPVAKKNGGAAKRKRVSAEDKVNALDLLGTMRLAAVAARMGTGESTIYASKKDEKKLRGAAASAKAGAKSTKGGEFPTVRRCVRALFFTCVCVCFICVRKKRVNCCSQNVESPCTDASRRWGPKTGFCPRLARRIWYPGTGDIFTFFL